MTDRVAYTITEAASRLGISRTTTYDLVRRGGLPHLRIGRSIRIPADALTEWVRAQTTTTGRHHQ